ncbi:hypothetical protein F66182_18524 [Fusarium sp. NRRL 66182]|nr:hypothetical protein F66182_18524 [Fusarium sp. NRRL 66182]
MISVRKPDDLVSHFDNGDTDDIKRISIELDKEMRGAGSGSGGSTSRVTKRSSHSKRFSNRHGKGNAREAASVTRFLTRTELQAECSPHVEVEQKLIFDFETQAWAHFESKTNMLVRLSKSSNMSRLSMRLSAIEQHLIYSLRRLNLVASSKAGTRNLPLLRQMKES